jgi:hypothetical protein
MKVLQKHLKFLEFQDLAYLEVALKMNPKVVQIENLGLDI